MRKYEKHKVSLIWRVDWFWSSVCYSGHVGFILECNRFNGLVCQTHTCTHAWRHTHTAYTHVHTHTHTQAYTPTQHTHTHVYAWTHIFSHFRWQRKKSRWEVPRLRMTPDRRTQTHSSPPNSWTLLTPAWPTRQHNRYIYLCVSTLSGSVRVAWWGGKG